MSDDMEPVPIEVSVRRHDGRSGILLQLPTGFVFLYRPSQARELAAALNILADELEALIR